MDLLKRFSSLLPWLTLFYVLLEKEKEKYLGRSSNSLKAKSHKWQNRAEP